MFYVKKNKHWPPACLCVAALTFSDIGSKGITQPPPPVSTRPNESSGRFKFSSFNWSVALWPTEAGGFLVKGTHVSRCRLDRPPLTRAGAGELVGWSPAHPPTHLPQGTGSPPADRSSSQIRLKQLKSDGKVLLEEHLISDEVLYNPVCEFLISFHQTDIKIESGQLYHKDIWIYQSKLTD